VLETEHGVAASGLLAAHAGAVLKS
jgi:hypothetical protein